jgi:hypothetical protein
MLPAITALRKVFGTTMTADNDPKLTMLSVGLAASAPGEGQYALLIYADDDLVAVLTPAPHASAEARRSWILEVGFGPCGGAERTVWRDLAEIHQWVLERCRAAAIGADPRFRRYASGRFRTGARAGHGDEGCAGLTIRPARRTRSALH